MLSAKQEQNTLPDVVSLITWKLCGWKICSILYETVNMFHAKVKNYVYLLYVGMLFYFIWALFVTIIIFTRLNHNTQSIWLWVELFLSQSGNWEIVFSYAPLASMIDLTQCNYVTFILC